MIPLSLPPKIIQKKQNLAVFEVEGLYPGYGITIGNTLRRILLSSLTGAAVIQAKIKNVQHEFSTIPGVKEDVVMILLNLKKLRFKIFEGDIHQISLKVKGEKEAKGSDFKLPPQVELSNPDCHIATLTDKNAELEIEIQIEKGVGYEPLERRKKKKTEIGTITLDAIYTPIKRVNLKVENMRVGERTDFDRLKLEVETDGTIEPEEALSEACQILIKHFTLFNDEISKGILKEKKALAEKTGKAEKKALLEATEIKVEDLKISARTLNALSKNNIKTVGGILRKNENSILELEGMGQKGVKEIKRKLKKLGLELKTE